MSARGDFTFFYPRRIRWSECDLQGVVFNPNYFVIVDEALTEYLRGLGLTAQDFLDKYDADFFTVNATADYRGPARFDEMVDIGLRVARIGRSSMTYAFAFLREEDLLVDGAMTYVCVDPATRTPKPLPGDYVQLLREFEKTPPEEK